jgi:hypothetical protein
MLYFPVFGNYIRTCTKLITTNADDGSAGTLRSQIANANDGTVIIFALGVTNITLVSGEILIDKPITITGNGLINTTVNRNATGRIFNITDGPVILNDMTLTNDLAENGGGSLLDLGATVTITNSELSRNTAVLAGGGIEDNSGTITIIL